MSRRKSTEQFAQELAVKHGGSVTLQPGAEYVGCQSKIAVHCEVCGHDWVARPNNLAIKGTGCPACMAVGMSALRYKTTIAFIGQTTSEGHKILEHVGYKASPLDIKRGTVGKAIYRYECSACGNTDAIGYGTNLKAKRGIAHCGCQKSRREHIGKFLAKPEWASSLCHYYIFTVNYDLQFKLGISNNIDRRGQYNENEEERYLSPIFMSQKLPRAWVWVAEQILLKKTAGYLAPVPEGWDPKWAGKSELRNLHLDVDEVVMDFYSLIEEIAQSDFHSVYKKYMRNAL